MGETFARNAGDSSSRYRKTIRQRRGGRYRVLVNVDEGTLLAQLEPEHPAAARPRLTYAGRRDADEAERLVAQRLEAVQLVGRRRRRRRTELVLLVAERDPRAPALDDDAVVVRVLLAGGVLPGGTSK